MAASCHSHLHDRPEPNSILCRLESDLQDQSTNSLIDPLGEPTLQLLSLVILGKAMPYLHNGIMVVDCDDDFAVRSRAMFFSCPCTHVILVQSGDVAEREDPSQQCRRSSQKYSVW